MKLFKQSKKKNEEIDYEEAAYFFMEFCKSYSQHFIGWGMNSVDHARYYLSGLLGTQRRKNIEVIEQDVVGSDYQGLKQFISSSPWDHQKLMDHIATDVSDFFNDAFHTGLFIDESSFLKKGDSSVAVQRQWSGRAGKIENCQVGVFACLGNSQNVCLTDFRLYLPKSWAEDKERMAKAKIPEDQREYKPKWQQALELVKHAQELNLKYGWVGFDSLYGSNRELVNAIEDLGEYFVGDVDKSTKVWTEKPLYEEPLKHSPKIGRPRKRYRISKENESEYIRVEDIAADSFDSEYKEVKYRHGAKGELWTKIMIKKVWTWEEGIEEPRQRILIIRQDADGSFKYSLTNILNGKSLSYYAWVQSQRFWIEHAFRECKSEIGMAQYQVRVWQGWHHHIALTALALLFTQKLKQKSLDVLPMLSVRDITELLDLYIPRRKFDKYEVINNIKKRHKQRELDILRRQKKKTGLQV